MPARGFSACDACPAGTRQANEGAKQCESCEPGWFSSSGSESCSICGWNDPNQGTVLIDDAQDRRYGINCSGGKLLGVLPDHWAERRLTPLNANETRVWRCDPPSLCKGGMDSTCIEGHTGPLCVDCVSGFYRNASKICEESDEHREWRERRDATVSNSTLFLDVSFEIESAVEAINATAFRLHVAESLAVEPSAVVLTGLAVLTDLTIVQQVRVHNTSRSHNDWQIQLDNAAQRVNATLWWIPGVPLVYMDPEYEQRRRFQLVGSLAVTLIFSSSAALCFLCVLFRKSAKWAKVADEEEAKDFAAKLRRQRLNWVDDSRQKEAESSTMGLVALPSMLLRQRTMKNLVKAERNTDRLVLATTLLNVIKRASLRKPAPTSKRAQNTAPLPSKGRSPGAIPS